MDTKTRKQEALELLALDELSGGKRYNLDYLTATRAIEIDGEDTPNHDYYGMHFTNSIDACLLLPVAGWVWAIHPPWEVILHEADGYYDTMIKAVNKPIPLAMLKCWWSIQPD